MSIIHPKRHTRPRPRAVHIPETTHHRLRRAYPAAIQFLRQPAAVSGFGTAAGTTRECTCGYKTRSPQQFLTHLEEKATLMPVASYQSPRPARPSMTHRLVDTAKQGTVFICSCGHDYTSLGLMQEHVRYADKMEADHA